jgi:S-(hydroxymethyl)glutathione dehydrogenase/alcohol dehydrogenase
MKIKKSLAAVLFESNKPLKLVEIEFPDYLEPGQVLVQLISSGICGAQINEIDAAKGPDNFLPHLLGHEGLAKVIEVGPGVGKIIPDDHVILHWRPSSGINSATPRYTYGGEVINAGWVTTFNEYAIVSENRMTRIDLKGINPIIAPLLGCALTTALGVLENDAMFTHRDSLLIVGFGGVGISIAKFAQFMNARKISVIDIDIRKKELALQMGIKDFIHFDAKPNVQKQLKKLFGNNKPTVAIDTTGHPDAIEICYEESDDTGRVVLVGVPKLGKNASLYTLPLHFGKSLTGSKGGGAKPDKDIPFILELLNENAINMNNYPVTVLPISKINEGIEKLRSGSLGRVVINFTTT